MRGCNLKIASSPLRRAQQLSGAPRARRRNHGLQEARARLTRPAQVAKAEPRARQRRGHHANTLLAAAARQAESCPRLRHLAPRRPARRRRASARRCSAGRRAGRTGRCPPRHRCMGAPRAATAERGMRLPRRSPPRWRLLWHMCSGVQPLSGSGGSGVWASAGAIRVYWPLLHWGPCERGRLASAGRRSRRASLDDERARDGAGAGTGVSRQAARAPSCAPCKRAAIGRGLSEAAGARLRGAPGQSGRVQAAPLLLALRGAEEERLVRQPRRRVHELCAPSARRALPEQP
jgi:hypothetical protein